MATRGPEAGIRLPLRFVAEEVDFAAEGLLEGVEGEARAARERLLRDLLDDGCTIVELRSAVEQDRLALLPVERLLRSEERYSAEDLAEQVGLPVAEIQEALAALGLPSTEPGVPCYGEGELELARLHQIGVSAGIRTPAIAEINRVIARGVAQIAAVSRTALIEATLQQGMTEREAGLLWARATRLLVPNTSRVIALAFEAQLRRLAASEYIGADEIVAGKTPGARHVNVAFADLVGFTRLGQRVPAEELGKIATRLEETAAQVMPPSVSLVKTIGDAVMLVSAKPEPLIEGLLALVDAARQLGGGFPQLRAGIAAGAALERAGDWYGETVNLASRITGVADPDAVVATEEVRRAAPDRYTWTDAGSPVLKGIAEAPRLYAVTRLDAGPGE